MQGVDTTGDLKKRARKEWGGEGRNIVKLMYMQGERVRVGKIETLESNVKRVTESTKIQKESEKSRREKQKLSCHATGARRDK